MRLTSTWIALIPAAVIVAEIISLIMNYSVVAVITKKVKEEQKKKEDQENKNGKIQQ